jgi:hypothetical protein
MSYSITYGAKGKQPAVAALSGAALGVATAFLVTYKRELTLSQMGTFSTMGIWGTLAGFSGGLGARLDRNTAWLVLGGEVAGVTAGILLAKRAGWRGGDLAYVNVTTAQAAAMGGGLFALLYRGAGHSDAERAGLGLITGMLPLAALTVSGLTSKRVSFSGRDAGLIVYTSVLGGYLGGLTAGMASDHPGGRRVGGALLVGEGIGYTIGLVASQLSELAPDRQGWLWFATYSGSAIGGGLGLMLRSLRGRTAYGLAGAGAGAGILLGTLGASKLSSRARDAPLSAFGLGYGTWLGAWLPTLFFGASQDADGLAAGGGALLGGFVGMLAGNITSRLTDVPGRTVGIATSTTTSSTLLGAGLGMMIPRTSGQTVVAIMHGVSAAGLATGAILAPRMRFSSADIGLVFTLAGYGSFSTAFLPVLWNDGDVPSREVGGGILMGLGLGALVGMAVAQASELDGGDVAELGIWSAGGLALGGGLGLLVNRDRKTTVGLLEGLGAAGLLTGALLTSRFTYSSRDRALLAHTILGGALQGTFLPDLWKVSPSGTERLGGILVGASVGMLAGALISQKTEVARGDTFEMTLALGAGNSLGAGAALLAGAKQTDTLRTMQGVGTALWVIGGLTASRTTYSAGDRGLVALSGIYGSFLGAWIPAFKSPKLGDADSSETGGGLAAGLGAGLVVGSVIAQLTDFRGHAVAELGYYAVGWSMFGAGLGLLMPTNDDRLPVGLMQGLGVTGTLVGTLLVNRTAYSSTDYFLTSGAVALGIFQGVGASLLVEASDRQLAGAILATAGLGGFAGSLVSQYIELTHPQLWTFFSGAIWGSWIGAFSANLARDHGANLSLRKVAGISMLASDLGLLLSGLALSPLVGMPPARLGWINLFGLGGMAAFTSIGAAFSDDGAQIGTIVGSVVGLAAGVIVTGFMSFDAKKKKRRYVSGAETGSESSTASQSPTPSPTNGAGLPSLIADWAPYVMVQPDLDPATGTTRSNNLQLVIGVSGRLH